MGRREHGWLLTAAPGLAADGVLGRGSHEGREYVVGVPIQGGPRTVVAHGGARVGVAGSDLDVAEVDACIEHGGHERVTQHVGVHASGGDPGRYGQGPQPSGGAVPIHPPPGPRAEQRAGVSSLDGAVHGPADGRRQGNEDDLVIALAVDPQDPVAVDLAEVFDAGAGGFEDPQPEQPEQGDEGEVVGVGLVAAGGEHGFELQVA